MYTTEVFPNYTNGESKEAEDQLEEIMDTATEYDFFDASKKLNRNEVLEVAERLIPERYQLVTDKLASEGLSIDQLADELLFDRLLGIDALISINGLLIALDVTSGNGTLLYNKKRKFEELKPAFDRLGISHACVVSLRHSITEEQIFSMLYTLAHLDKDTFCLVLKYRNQN